MKYVSFLIFIFVILTFYSCHYSDDQTKNDVQDRSVEIENKYIKDELKTGKKVDKDTLVLFHFGYRNNRVIMRDWDTTLYEYKHNQGVFTLYGQLDKPYKPLYINDNCIVYYHSEDNFLLIKHPSKESKKIPFGSIPRELIMNTACNEIYYFNDFGENVKKIDLQTNKTEKMPFKGYFINYINGNIYFVDGAGISGLVDVYRYREGDIKKLVKQVYAEGLFFTPDENYIASFITVKGKVHHSIYSIEKDKFYLSGKDIDEDIKSANYKLYLPRKNSFLYYRPTGFEFSIVEEPQNFDYQHNPW